MGDDGEMAAIKLLKKQFRQKIKETLATLSTEEINSQTNTAVARLLALPEYQRAKKISVYLSMPTGEISTASIVQDALRQGKQVFVPYTYKRPKQGDGPTSIMDMLQLNSLNDFQSMKLDKWGIPTPSEDTVGERMNSFGSRGLSNGTTTEAKGQGLDLIVVPGMAFDESFRRLGHGKGFYDHFFDRCLKHNESIKDSHMPFLAGLALKEQVLLPTESVPVDSTDWNLDAIVVGDGRILRAGAR